MTAITTTAAHRKTLAGLDTTALIAQYDLAISTYRGRLTNTSPGQRRIDYIVDLLSGRADDGDAVALAWFAS